jgi:galactokinase
VTDEWTRRLQAHGLSEPAAGLAAIQFARAATVFADRFGGDPASAWWIPGRIEVLGKHTDYGGGRSLLCTVERGFHLVARPNTDGMVRLIDAKSGARLEMPLAADVPPQPGRWGDYPITVVRRVARDFPAARTGIDAAFVSSLPPASGLSSSSALVIATFLPLADANALSSSPQWQRSLPDQNAVAGYLGAVENGKAFDRFPADHGVGTHGGSEDHTAILCCRAGRLSQFHFLPVTEEHETALPSGWVFVIAMSGVHAAKGSGALASYNRLSLEIRTMLNTWRGQTYRDDASLFAALRSAPDAPEKLAAMLRFEGEKAEPLLERLDQFRAETEEIIPAVSAALARGDIAAIGPLVDRSQALAERVLRNQVPETVDLVHRARALGAVAASAFGAGFGGSVWALVPAVDAEQFRHQWRSGYLETFPAHRSRADFFLSQAGPPAGTV